jgi:acyl-CoA synthetase (NDP forming)
VARGGAQGYKQATPLHRAPTRGLPLSADRSSLEFLFRPRAMAVIGASATPGKQGNVALKFARAAGFPGPVHPINPAGGEIEGLTCYPSIEDAPGPVDCVFTVIPAAATAEALRACARKGVRVAIIGASGFAERGDDVGRVREAEIRAIARETGMRILGPNTNGVWNASDKVSLGFNTSHGDPLTPGEPGKAISIVAHSGALFNSIAPCLRRYGVGFSKFAPVGNEADIDMLEVFDFLIDDPATGCIGLVVEGLPDAEPFRALAARAYAAGKPVIALKLGRSRAGAQAALAHSSRLAGSARAYAALFAECGVAAVSSIETMAGAAALLMGCERMDLSGDPGLVCVTTTGGGGSLLADHAADRGIPLAGGDDGLWRGKAAEVIATFEGAGLIRNPVDGGNLVGWKRLAPLLEAVDADGQRGPGLLYAHMLPMEANDMLVADTLIARKARTGAPLAVVSPGGLRPRVDAHYRAHGAVVFDELATCFDALGAFYDSMAFDADDLIDPPQEAPAFDAATAARLREMIARAAPGDFLAEDESAALLRLAGAPMVESVVVADAAQARAALARFGAPIALKGLAPGVAHKNDAGLVFVGLRDEAAVDAAYADLIQKLAALGGGRVIAQPMVAAKAELILGVAHAPPLGHFLVLGLGGVHAELLDSVTLIPVFASRARIADVVEGSLAGEFVARVCGDQAAARCSDIVNALVALRDLVRACGAQIAGVDVNPLLVGPQGCTAVDALVTRAPAP